MAIPYINSFSGEEHQEGDTGLVVECYDAGNFPGELWMLNNADPAVATLSDELTVTDWGDQGLGGVSIPVSPNNNPGNVWLAIKTFTNEWSSPTFPFTFTLTAAGAPGALKLPRGMITNVGYLMRK